MRIVTTVIALLLAMVNIKAQMEMKENVNFNVWPKGQLNSAYDKDKLIAVISSILPFIGYPRTLNALNCIRSVEADK